MIVEPVPTSGRSRRRRVAGAFAIAAPIVLLAAVVATGVLGARPAPRPPAVAIAPDATNAVASPDPAVPADDGTPPGPASGITLPPDVIETIPVRTVDATEADPPVPGQVIAVAGYLAFDGITGGCAPGTPALDATFCERTALLRADARGAPTLVGNRMAVIRLAVPPGVRIPRQAVPSPRSSAGGGQVRVVALVRAGRAGYRLERVAWVAGFRWRAPSIDPDLGRNPFDEGWWRRRLDAEAAMGLTARNGSVVMLVTAYLRLPALEAADDGAASAVRRETAAAGHPLWYVRALFPGGVGEGLPRRDEQRWLVVDDTTGEVVARGAG